MRFFLALRLTTVRRIAQVKTVQNIRMATATKTIQPPHCMFGMKSKISMRKANKVTIRVATVRRRSPRRYRDEWEGLLKCELKDMIKQRKIIKAETGWTTRMDESLCRLLGCRLTCIGTALHRPSAYVSLVRNLSGYLTSAIANAG